MKKCAVLLLLLATGPVQAETGYYLITMYPFAGEKSVDFKYWNAKPDGQPPRNAPELGFGYAVSEHWYTELSATWFQISPGAHHYSAWEWQNDFLLTHGQYDVDVALHSKVTHNDSAARGTGFEFGPVLQTEIGKTQWNLNVLLQRSVGTPGPQQVELAYQWQVRQHWRRGLHVGLQGFGELGKWNDWLPRARQSHRVGPAVFGTVARGGGAAWRYEAAWLVGKNGGRAAKTLTARLQYVFR